MRRVTSASSSGSTVSNAHAFCPTPPRPASTVPTTGAAQLCSDGNRPSRHGGSANDFELIDALTRIGMTLQQIAPIIAETREAPEDFEQILDRLDAVLDRVLPS